MSKVGKHVSFKYRSGGGQGKVTGVVKQGSTDANTMFAIQPDAQYRHPGEPARIHRLGKHLRVTGKK